MLNEKKKYLSINKKKKKKKNLTKKNLYFCPLWCFTAMTNLLHTKNTSYENTKTHEITVS